MKKIVFASLVVLGLSGCATNQQTGALAGAAVGAATGKVLGGQAGAAFGTVLGAAAGSSVGQSLDNQQGMIISQMPRDQIYQVAPPGIVYVHPYWPAPYADMRWIYVPRYGWGWHHPHRGFHYRHHRHYR